MKLCIFTHTFPRFEGDTAAPFMGELAGVLSKKHDVYVLTPFDKEIKLNKKKPYKLITYKYIFPESLHILGYSRTLKGDRKMGIIALLLSPFMYFFGFLSLLKLVRKEKIDIVSSHWIIPNGFLAALVKAITGVPFTSTIPGSDVYMAGKNFFFRWMAKFASQNADYILSDSSHYIKQLNDLRIFPKNVEIVRYGVSSKKFKRTKKDRLITKKYGIGKDEKIVLAVGRMVAKKGFIYLIEAVPYVVKRVKNVKFVMVGDGELKGDLEIKVGELGVKDKAVFTGMVSHDQLSKYYNLADIFVMPSIKDEKGNIDASPVTMMEAMMCGAPVVATKFSGSKDLVKEGETGYLVREKSSREIGEAIVKLLAKRGNFGRRVRRIAVDNFSLDFVSDKYSNIFRGILK